MDTIVVFSPAPGPSSGGGLTRTYLGQFSTADSQSSTSIDFTSLTLGTGKIIAIVSNRDGGQPTSLSSPTGTPALVTDGTTTAAQSGESAHYLTAWEWDSTSASGTVTVNTSAAMRWCSVRLYLVENMTAFDTVVTGNEAPTTAAPWSIDLSLATSSGGIALAAASTYQDGTFLIDWDDVVGVTLDTDAGDTQAPTGNFFSYSATGTSAETRTVSVGDSDATASRNAALAIAIS